MAETGKQCNLLEAASNSKRTVDDVFQYLVRILNRRPAKAIDQIFKALRHDRLQVELRIRGGVRKINPLRPATDEERENKSAGVWMWHLYELAPPEGITQTVHFQEWGRTFNLMLRDDRLVIELVGYLEYPDDAYSFTIANWSLVEELWPNPNRVEPASNPSPAGAAAAAIERSPRSAESIAAPEMKVAAALTPSLAPAVKMVSRSKWLNAHLTEKRRKELKQRHNKITPAVEEIHEDMKSDPTVKEYARARNIERHKLLQKLYPKNTD